MELRLNDLDGCFMAGAKKLLFSTPRTKCFHFEFSMLGRSHNFSQQTAGILILFSKSPQILPAGTSLKWKPNGNQSVARFETGCPTFSASDPSPFEKKSIWNNAITSMRSLNLAVAIPNSPASLPPSAHALTLSVLSSLSSFSAQPKTPFCHLVVVYYTLYIILYILVYPHSHHPHF